MANFSLEKICDILIEAAPASPEDRYKLTKGIDGASIDSIRSVSKLGEKALNSYLVYLFGKDLLDHGSLNGIRTTEKGLEYLQMYHEAHGGKLETLGV